MIKLRCILKLLKKILLNSCSFQKLGNLEFVDLIKYLLNQISNFQNYFRFCIAFFTNAQVTSWMVTSSKFPAALFFCIPTEEECSLDLLPCWDSTDQYVLRLSRRDDSQGAEGTTFVRYKMTRLRT